MQRSSQMNLFFPNFQIVNFFLHCQYSRGLHSQETRQPPVLSKLFFPNSQIVNTRIYSRSEKSRLANIRMFLLKLNNKQHASASKTICIYLIVNMLIKICVICNLPKYLFTVFVCKNTVFNAACKVVQQKKRVCRTVIKNKINIIRFLFS